MEKRYLVVIDCLSEKVLSQDLLKVWRESISQQL